MRKHILSKKAQETRERQATALETIRSFGRPVTLKEVYERMRIRATFSEVESAVSSLRMNGLVVARPGFDGGRRCNLLAAVDAEKKAG